ncbi:hypothetical protein AB0H83_32015 [Dactylosporangium sp. NPDC050688]|uniref:hypothetical protein n=1 Tax=Dactylosporangium sp. NPDC050688 TaxID=3157217 RepID=UPI0033ECFF58
MAAARPGIDAGFTQWTQQRVEDGSIRSLADAFGIPATYLTPERLAEVREHAMESITDQVTRFADTTPERVLDGLAGEFDRQALRVAGQVAADRLVERYFDMNQRTIGGPEAAARNTLAAMPPEVAAAVKESVGKSVRSFLDEKLAPVLAPGSRGITVRAADALRIVGEVPAGLPAKVDLETGRLAAQDEAAEAFAAAAAEHLGQPPEPPTQNTDPVTQLLSEFRQHAVEHLKLGYVAGVAAAFHNTYGHLDPYAPAPKDGTPEADWNEQVAALTGKLPGQLREVAAWDKPLLDRWDRLSTVSQQWKQRARPDSADLFDRFGLDGKEPGAAALDAVRNSLFRDLGEGFRSVYPDGPGAEPDPAKAAEWDAKVAQVVGTLPRTIAVATAREVAKQEAEARFAEHLSGRGLVPLGQEAIDRVRSGYLERVDAAFTAHFKAGEPGDSAAYGEHVDRLTGELDEHLAFESDAAEGLTRAGAMFDGLAGRHTTDEAVRDELAPEFRDDWFHAFHETWAPKDGDAYDWLRHEGEHENAFQSARPRTESRDPVDAGELVEYRDPTRTSPARSSSVAVAGFPEPEASRPSTVSEPKAGPDLTTSDVRDQPPAPQLSRSPERARPDGQSRVLDVDGVWVHPLTGVRTRAAFDVRLTGEGGRPAAELTLRLRIVPDAALAARDLVTTWDTVRAAVEEYYNAPRYEFRKYGTAKFSVVPVTDGPAHQEIALGRHARVTQRSWRPDMTAQEIAHELGHSFGFLEEHRQPGDPETVLDVPGSLMGRFRAPVPEDLPAEPADGELPPGGMRQRYLDLTERLIDARIDGGPLPRPFPQTVDGFAEPHLPSLEAPAGAAVPVPHPGAGLTEVQRHALSVAAQRGAAAHDANRAALMDRVRAINERAQTGYPVDDPVLMEQILEAAHLHLQTMPIARNIDLGRAPSGAPSHAGRRAETWAEHLTRRERFPTYWENGYTTGTPFRGGRGWVEEQQGYASVLNRVSGDPADIRDRAAEFDPTDPTALPVYGALLSGLQHGGTYGYGSTVLYLKEEVRQRATYTPQDSAAPGLSGIAGYTDHKHLYGLLAHGPQDNVRLVLGGVTGFRYDEEMRGDIKRLGYAALGRYFEAQIHGGMSWHDVARVTVNWGDLHGSLTRNTTREEAQGQVDFLRAFAAEHGYTFKIELGVEIGSPDGLLRAETSRALELFEADADDHADRSTIAVLDRLAKDTPFPSRANRDEMLLLADRVRIGGSDPGTRLRELFDRTRGIVANGGGIDEASRELGLPGPHQGPSAEQILADLRSSARVTAPADGLLGPDLFGLREAPPPPSFLSGLDQSQIPTSMLWGFFHKLNMAAVPEDRLSDTPLRLSDFFDAPASVVTVERQGDPREWSTGARLPDDMEDIPQSMEMPVLLHSPWLGSPLAADTATKQEFQENLAEMAAAGVPVVLWTDIPRATFHLAEEAPENVEGPLAGVRQMLDWARRHDIWLINVDEIFHADAPMRLAAQYRMEMAKRMGLGYAAASDIVRLEIERRFGGGHTDPDNRIEVPESVAVDELLRSQLGPDGFAVHALELSGGVEVANSAMLAARNHPFVNAYLDRIAHNYTLPQSQLGPGHNVTDRASAEAWTWPDLRHRRSSVLARTGPENLTTPTWAGYPDYRALPRLTAFTMGSAQSWLPSRPFEPVGQFTASEVPDVVKGVVATLVRELYNRDGDLHLTYVAPVVEALPVPAAAWRAVTDFILDEPSLASRVTTVTDRILVDDHGRPAVVPLDVPADVLRRFGLDPAPADADLPGQWRLGELARPVDLTLAEPRSGPHTTAPSPTPQQVRRDGQPEVLDVDLAWVNPRTNVRYRAAFDVVLRPGAAELTQRLTIVPDATVTPEQLARIWDQVSAAETLFNDSPYQFRQHGRPTFRLPQATDSPAHAVISLSNLNTEVTQFQWHPDMDVRAVAHELGHGFFFLDEYRGPGAAQGSLDVPGSLMGRFDDPVPADVFPEAPEGSLRQGGLRQRYLDLTERVIDARMLAGPAPARSLQTVAGTDEPHMPSTRSVNARVAKLEELAFAGAFRQHTGVQPRPLTPAEALVWVTNTTGLEGNPNPTTEQKWEHLRRLEQRSGAIPTPAEPSEGSGTPIRQEVFASRDRRPWLQEGATPPPGKPNGVVRFADDHTVPKAVPSAFGRDRPSFKLTDEIARRIADEHNLRRSARETIARDLRERPERFFGEGYRLRITRGDGTRSEIIIRASNYGEWSRYSAAATFRAEVKTVLTKYGKRALTTKRHVSDTVVHIDDVHFLVTDGTNPRDGAPPAGFTVRNGLHWQLSREATKPRSFSDLPSRITYNEETRVGEVEVEGVSASLQGAADFLKSVFPDLTPQSPIYRAVQDFLARDLTEYMPQMLQGWLDVPGTNPPGVRIRAEAENGHLAYVSRQPPVRPAAPRHGSGGLKSMFTSGPKSDGTPIVDHSGQYGVYDTRVRLELQRLDGKHQPMGDGGRSTFQLAPVTARLRMGKAEADRVAAPTLAEARVQPVSVTDPRPRFEDVQEPVERKAVTAVERTWWDAVYRHYQDLRDFVGDARKHERQLELRGQDPEQVLLPEIVYGDSWRSAFVARHGTDTGLLTDPPPVPPDRFTEPPPQRPPAGGTKAVSEHLEVVREWRHRLDRHRQDVEAFIDQAELYERRLQQAVETARAGEGVVAPSEAAHTGGTTAASTPDPVRLVSIMVHGGNHRMVGLSEPINVSRYALGKASLKAGLPYATQIVDKLMDLAQANGVTIPPERLRALPMELANSYMELLSGYLLNLGGAEVLIGIDPTHFWKVAHPGGSFGGVPGRYGDDFRGTQDEAAPPAESAGTEETTSAAPASSPAAGIKATEVTHGRFQTGTHGYAHTGQMGVTNLNATASAGVGIGPDIAHVAKVSVSLNVTKNKVTNTIKAEHDAEQGMVDTNRGPQVAVAGEPNFWLQFRVDGAIPFADVERHAIDGPKNEKLIVWVSESDLGPRPAETVTVRKPPARDAQMPQKPAVEMPQRPANDSPEETQRYEAELQAWKDAQRDYYLRLGEYFELQAPPMPARPRDEKPQRSTDESEAAREEYGAALRAWEGRQKEYFDQLHEYHSHWQQYLAHIHNLADQRARQTGLPDILHASEVTGKVELFDNIVRALRERGLDLPIGHPTREDLRQRVVLNLNTNLKDAANDENGYHFTVGGRGGDRATVWIFAERNDGELVSPPGKGSQIEDVRTAIQVMSGSQGVGQETKLTLSGGVDLIPMPAEIVKVSATASLARSWSDSAGLGAGRAGLWVLVSRYRGYTSGYDASVTLRAFVSTSKSSDLGRYQLAPLPVRARLQIPEVDAYLHGFQVAKEAVTDPSDLSPRPGAIRDTAPKPDDPKAVPLPQHVQRGKGPGFGLVKTDQGPIKTIHNGLLEELRRTGFVPDQHHPFSESASTRDSMIDNLHFLRKMVSRQGFDSFATQMRNDGMIFTLVRRSPTGPTRYARITIKVEESLQEYTDHEGNRHSEYFVRYTDELTNTNLTMGMDSMAPSISGGTRDSAGIRATVGYTGDNPKLKFLRAGTVGYEFAKGYGASEAQFLMTNMPYLAEFPGRLAEFRIPGKFIAIIEYSSLKLGVPRPISVDGFSTLHIADFINNPPKAGEPVISQPMSMKILQDAVPLWADTQGVIDAIRRLLPDMTGPGEINDEAASIFGSNVIMLAHLPEIFQNTFVSDQFFDPGFLRDSMAAMAIRATPGAIRYAGSATSKFVLGLIKLWLAQASQTATRSTGHSLTLQLGAGGPVDDTDMTGSLGGSISWGKSESYSSLRAGARELLELIYQDDADSVLIFDVDLSYHVRAVKERHSKLWSTSVDPRTEVPVAGRSALIALSRFDALEHYRNGDLPIPDAVLHRILTNWNDGKFKLSGNVVAGVLARRMSSQAQFGEWDGAVPLAEWARILREKHNSGELHVTGETLQQFNAEFPERRLDGGGNPFADKWIPPYLKRPGVKGLGFVGVHRLTFDAELKLGGPDGAQLIALAADPKLGGPDGAQLIDLVLNLVQESRPGLITSDPEVWYKGGDGVIGKMQGGLVGLQAMVGGKRVEPMLEDMMHEEGVQFVLGDRKGAIGFGFIKITMKYRLTEEPAVVEMVEQSGIESYVHGYDGRSETRAQNFGYSANTSLRTGDSFGHHNPDEPTNDLAKGSLAGTPGVNAATGSKTAMTYSETEVKEQTFYGWNDVARAKVGHRLKITVEQVDLAGAPVTNLFNKIHRNVTGQGARVEREYAGTTVLKLPRSLVDAVPMIGPHKPDYRPVTRWPADANFSLVLLDSAMPVLRGLMVELVGKEADDPAYLSSLSVPVDLSRTGLQGHLHQAVAGNVYVLGTDIVLPGRTSKRMTIFMTGDVYDIREVAFSDLGTGVYVKNQKGGAFSHTSDSLRAGWGAGMDSGGAVHIKDQAHQTADYGADQMAGAPGTGFNQAHGQTSTYAANTRLEDHNKRVDGHVLVEVRGTFVFGARLVEKSNWLPDDVEPIAYSEPVSGPVYAWMPVGEMYMLRQGLQPLDPIGPDPATWPQVRDDAPRRDLIELLAEVDRQGYDQFQAAGEVAQALRADVGGVPARGGHDASTHPGLVLISRDAEAAVRAYEAALGRAQRELRGIGREGVDAPQEMGSWQESLERRKPPIFDLHPVPIGRQVARELQINVEVRHTGLDGVTRTYRIDPLGRQAEFDPNGRLIEPDPNQGWERLLLEEAAGPTSDDDVPRKKFSDVEEPRDEDEESSDEDEESSDEDEESSDEDEESSDEDEEYFDAEEFFDAEESFDGQEPPADSVKTRDASSAAVHEPEQPRAVIHYDEDLHPNPNLYWNTDRNTYRVGNHSPGTGWEVAGQFCAYLAIHWLTSGTPPTGLRFDDLNETDRRAAVFSHFLWTDHGGLAAQVEQARAMLSAQSPAENQSTPTIRSQTWPAGTRIWFGNDRHALAAIVGSNGQILVYDPNTGMVESRSPLAFDAYVRVLGANEFVVAEPQHETADVG